MSNPVDHLHELQLMEEDLFLQSKLYWPTPFWQEASANLGKEIAEQGLEQVRRLHFALSYFVPTYGYPGNGLSIEQSEQLREALVEASSKQRQSLECYLSGENQALSDYRVLLAADEHSRRPYLHTFSESPVGAPLEQFEFEGRKFSRSALNYLLGLALLKKHLGDELIETVLEVGGGFGTLGEILSYSGLPTVCYIDVDIPPTTLIAQYYLSQVLGDERVAKYASTRHLEEIAINSLPHATVLSSWQIERLQGDVDLFVNFISFQEMEPPVVENYLNHVSRLKSRWILLRNMREGKQIRKEGESIGVDCPILSGDYLDMLPDYDLVERNVFPYGFRTVDGFHSELLLLKRK